MATEEERAVEHRAKLKRRRQAERDRALALRGNPEAKAALEDDLAALRPPFAVPDPPPLDPYPIDKLLP